jgi:hypothetical protein
MPAGKPAGIFVRAPSYDERSCAQLRDATHAGAHRPRAHRRRRYSAAATTPATAAEEAARELACHPVRQHGIPCIQAGRGSRADARDDTRLPLCAAFILVLTMTAGAAFARGGGRPGGGPGADRRRHRNAKSRRDQRQRRYSLDEVVVRNSYCEERRRSAG